MRELMFHIDGTAGTPSASGFDRFGIASVTDLGAGNYTIIFANPSSSQRACMLKSAVSATADIAVQVTAEAYDRVTILCILMSTTAATDADVNLCVALSDARYDV